MKTLQERLIEEGVTQEELDRFTRSACHNDKEDVFGSIINSCDFEDLPKLQRNLANVLAEMAFEENIEKVLLEEDHPQRIYLNEDYEEFVIRKMAYEMLQTLMNNQRRYTYEGSLDDIYQDTFKTEEVTA